MKARTQKLISLLLVLVMLVTMIPAGIFTASAEDSAIVIENLDQWNSYAETGTETFAGKTVKLGADISGVTKPLATTFSGTFDGAGYKIYNSEVTGNGVIANTLAGGATVQNVKFEKVKVTGTAATGMIAGTFDPAASGETTTITKISIDDQSNVTGTPTGGLIGTVASDSNYTLSISNALVKATVSGGTSGGLIGTAAAVGTKAVISVKSTWISASNTSGGVIGNFAPSGHPGGSTAKYSASAAVLMLDSVVISGSSTHAVCASSTTFNVQYTKLYVTTTGSLFNSSSYNSWLNKVHIAKNNTTAGRYSVTAAHIADKEAIEAPTVISAADAEFYFTRDADGFLVFDSQILADYNEKGAFEIWDLDDWKALATNEYSFEGKTVRLMADIDVNGALPTLANVFRGTFDGNGKTISNATVTGNGVIANTLAGGTTVQNVKFEGVTVDVTGNAGMIAGTFSPSGTTNITKIDIDVASSVTGTGATGGLFGSILGASNYTLDISNVSVKAAIKGTNAGGLIGMEGDAKTLFANATVKVSTSLVAPTSLTGSTRTGGIIGYYTGGNTGDSTKEVSATAPFVELNDVVVVGTPTNAVGYFKNINLKYSNLYVTSEKHIVYADGWFSFINGVHVSENNTTGTRYGITAANIADKNKIEAPKVVNAGVAHYFAVRDAEGFITQIREIDPSTCSHSEYSQNITTPATGFVDGEKECACLNCGYSWTEKIELDFTLDELKAEIEKNSSITIKSVAEWNVVATSGLTFAGKTILLGANIDFDNKEALPLVPASLGATTMKFDGQGYKIMNATASAPLIAGILTSSNAGLAPTGGTSAKPITYTLEQQFAQANTIKNVTFEKITMTAKGNVALVVGKLTGDSMDYKFENIKVIDCDITSTEGSAAALFVTHERGNAGSYNCSLVSIKNVTVDADTNITAYNLAAGLFVNASGSTNTGLFFENIYVAATIKSTYVYDAVNDGSTTSLGMVGGLAAEIADPGSRTVRYSFKNIAVVGSLLSENGKSYQGRIGGLIAFAGGVGAFDVANVIIDLREYTDTQNYRYSLAMLQDTSAVVTYYNLYIGKAPTNEYMNGNASKLFDTAIEGGKAMNLSDTASIDAAKMADILTMENGYVKSIKEVIRAAGYQTGNKSNDDFALRFLGLSQLTDVERVDMKIEAVYNGGKKTFDTASKNCFGYADGERVPAPGAVLYDELSVYGDQGVQSVTAAELNAAKIAGFTIYEIPTKTDITFTVTLYWTGAYGQLVESAPLTITVAADGTITPAPTK